MLTTGLFTIDKTWNQSIKIPIIRWMDKGNVTFIHTEILFCYEKEWNPVVFSKMLRTGGHHAEWYKLDTKEQIPLYMGAKLKKTGLQFWYKKSTRQAHLCFGLFQCHPAQVLEEKHNMETTQMPVSSWMDKENTLHLLHGILLSP